MSKAIKLQTFEGYVSEGSGLRFVGTDGPLCGCGGSTKRWRDINIELLPKIKYRITVEMVEDK